MERPLSDEVFTRRVSVSQLHATEYTVSRSSSSHHEYVLLLHGWLGTSNDFGRLGTHLSRRGYTTLALDLPFHGSSINARATSVPQAANMILNALPHFIGEGFKPPHPIRVVGYSLGGRIALEMAKRIELDRSPAVRITALVLISCAPPPEFIEDYAYCRSESISRADDFLDLPRTKEAFEQWLRLTWYNGQMWGSISTSPAFNAMVRARVNSHSDRQVRAWARALTSLCRSTMTSVEHQMTAPTLYICGIQDSKYVNFSKQIEYCCENIQCVQVHDTGHNVFLQSPDLVASCVCEFFNDMCPVPRRQPLLSSLSISIKEYSLSLTKPMVVNNQTLGRREGFLIAISEQYGFSGVGDVCPLPGLHEVSLEMCRKEIRQFAAKLRKLNQLFCDTTQIVGIVCNLTSTFSSVTKNAICCAMLHLASQVQGSSFQSFLYTVADNSTFQSPASRHRMVHVNGVLPRQQPMSQEVNGDTPGTSRYAEFVRGSPFELLKLKVGAIADVEQDAEQTAEAIQICRSVGKTLRLDANRAWVPSKFEVYRNKLGVHARHVEYIEEPLQCEAELQNYLGSAPEKNSLCIALDESLAHCAYKTIEEMAVSRLCKAFVIKPAVVGCSTSIFDLTGLAQKNNCDVVFSTVFDSGVGTSWTALLASVLSEDHIFHGLGTYRYLEEDVLLPGFGHFCTLANGGSISIHHCDEFLNRAAAHTREVGKIL